MKEQNLSTFSRLRQFIRERFPLSTHLPMILSFSWANITIGATALGKGIDAGAGGVACLITFFFFLRLRLFDELKDLEYDRIANPSRPLVRGLVASKELRYLISFAAIIECLLVLVLSPAAILAYVIALGFSLFMFKEFFIGDLIRPHLTTYAVLHTFVSVLMGYMVAAVSQNVSILEFPTHLFLFGIINWTLFNIFEFARKTFARDEERDGIETYSSKFSPLGATALVASQMLIVALTNLFLIDSMLAKSIVLFQLMIMAIVITGMWLFLAHGTKRSATTYRALAGFYIIFTYISFAMRNT